MIVTKIVGIRGPARSVPASIDRTSGFQRTAGRTAPNTIWQMSGQPSPVLARNRGLLFSATRAEVDLPTGRPNSGKSLSQLCINYRGSHRRGEGMSRGLLA